METRKVQVTGGSSYVITLPKEWITRNEVRKNDPLGIIYQPDGSLVVTPKTEGEKERRIMRLDVERVTDPTYLYRLLIAAYVQGYSIIEVRSAKRMPPLVRDTVTEFTQTTVGPEIMEEEVDRIVVRDLLDPAEMPFENTIKRMYILVRTMIQDAVRGLQLRDAALIEDIMMRDGAIDRLNWLVARQASICSLDPLVARRMDVGPEDVMFYYLLARILERVGDHAVIIATNAGELIGSKPMKEAVDAIETASEAALEILTGSIDAWSTRNIAAANAAVEAVGGIDPYHARVIDNAFRARGPTSVAEASIAASLRRIAEYSGDIAELTINRLIRTQDAP